MNDIQAQILQKINAICKEEGFKIIDTKDFLSDINNLDFEFLQDSINMLKDTQLIEVKYSDMDEYCLAITNNGRLTVDKIIKAQESAAATTQGGASASQGSERKANKSKKGMVVRKKEEIQQPLPYEEESVVAQDTYIKDNESHNPTIVIKEVMLNRATLVSIARIAFFSGFLGAIMGSIIIAIIFMFI